MKVTLIEDLGTTTGSEPLNLDQLVTSALFGGNLTMPTYYDSAQTYAKNDKILYKDADGKLTIMYCKNAGVTGTYNASDWAVFSLFDGSGSANAMTDSTLVRTLDNDVVSRLLHI